MTVQKIDDPELGEMWLPTFPAIFHGMEIEAKNPLFSGAANKEVFSTWLGLDKKDIENLAEKKII